MIMRTITLIIIHCSATPEGRRLDFETCRRDHIRHRGFTDIGYHFYITRDGEIHRGRPLEKVGAHCKNHNRHSIGICYEGGLSADCTSADTRTLMQKGSMLALLRELRLLFAPVEVTRVNGGQEYIVNAGLNSGDVIVAEGVGLLREGTPIEVKQN